jgi:tellurite resistance protein TerC
MLFIDLYVTDHRHGKITLKASLIWSGIWIITALLFNIFIYVYLESGHQKALEFLTGYIIEKSLSVDNLFVFLMIFSVMGIKPENQPHILKWGILSAIVFRIIFIFAGVALINLFHPIIYVFAIILLLAAYKMAFGGEQKIDIENNWLIKIAGKYFKLNTTYVGKRFFIKVNNKIFITTTFLTLLLIESSDIVFAVDSIPAIIAITKDSFIIISSNIFAILGLRALYFALAGLVDLFIYLKYGVAIILFYVGIKMLISEFYKIPTEISLIVIVSFLLGSIILSLIKRKRFSQ